jgi:hypothetical protein
MKTSIFDLLISERKVGRVYCTLVTGTRAAADILIANGNHAYFEGKPAEVIDNLLRHLDSFADNRPWRLKEAQSERVREFERVFRQTPQSEAGN